MTLWDTASLIEARLLIVDDEEPNVELLDRLLRRAGYVNVECTTDPRSVQDLVTEFEPDLILLDLLMPHLDGFAVMEQIRLLEPAGSPIPILVLTADATPETKRRALARGAQDFLTKPFDVDEVLLRIRNMLETRTLQLQLRDQNEVLEELVRIRTRDLEAAQAETFDRLAITAEYRDDDTGQHTMRVGRTSGLIARELGLPKDECELIERAARLHDLGKIAIPDSILLAPRKLTPEEFQVVKTHTTIGADILAGSYSPVLQLAQAIAQAHHERWDGSGYAGLAGEAIPLAAAITTVADVFDALVHERPYKPAWPVEQAIAEIEAQRERQFDPKIVDAFLRVQDEALLLHARI